MSTSIGSARWAHTVRAPLASQQDSNPEEDDLKYATEGYWQEWAPVEPDPHTMYCTELHLAPGAYILYATANVRLASRATTASDVECSLFVGHHNVSPHHVRLVPGDVICLATTSHADVQQPTTIQWNCGSTTGPWQLDLAVTAVKVDVLHHGG